MILVNFYHQFTKKRVGPGKPLACKIVWIILIERFVHKSGACMGIFQPFQTGFNFSLVRRGDCPHYNTHWPDIAQPYMRTADTLACFTPEEVWI